MYQLFKIDNFSREITWVNSWNQNKHCDLTKNQGHWIFFFILASDDLGGRISDRQTQSRIYHIKAPISCGQMQPICLFIKCLYSEMGSCGVQYLQYWILMLTIIGTVRIEYCVEYVDLHDCSHIIPGSLSSTTTWSGTTSARRENNQGDYDN